MLHLHTKNIVSVPVTSVMLNVERLITFICHFECAFAFSFSYIKQNVESDSK